ncbi:hypothetical protein VWN94_10890, partial [Campylobacter coli]|nr:hypothetical protein [Campylobacter coli]
PDFVYMPIYHPEAALIARQAKQIGFDKLLAAGDGVNNQTFIESIANEKNLDIESVKEKVIIALINTAKRIYGQEYDFFVDR